MTKVRGLKVLITGGSSGIGKATAKQLAAQGAVVCITGRDKSKLDRVASEINAIPIHLDVTKYNNIAVKVLDAFHSMGGIDVLVNNAGIGSFSKLDEIKVSDFEEVFSTNIYGLTMMTQEVVKFFKTQQFGTIINIGSTASTNGFGSGSVCQTTDKSSCTENPYFTPRALIASNDIDDAKTILQGIVNTGSEAQKHEAKLLYMQIK